ncbi:hypothetical protein [Saccharopolyspora elongata]|uniref:Uncharacterized protein n=1 Tax=Saccharopolyspora elongata TaxID=2530387 RepID=A0A4R4Y156_9PSEU|nr:hypothetical protein [Saccharopolyspora elongata]TDD37785.1 hypothetical protein E1288_39980 [Saccharopolyspora elongata]
MRRYVSRGARLWVLTWDVDQAWGHLAILTGRAPVFVRFVQLEDDPPLYELARTCSSASRGGLRQLWFLGEGDSEGDLA